MTDELKSALVAIDRLNSWVRSESFRRNMFAYSLRRFIYHVKRQALLAAHDAVPCQHLSFILQVKCRDCGGSGRYIDCEGYERDHCWACRNTGTATLYFVESKIGDLFTWHSPTSDFPRELVGSISSEGTTGEGWTVNQKGNDLTPDQAAECLNIVHEYFPKRAPMRGGYSRDIGEWETDDNQYNFWIGEDEPKCAHCGATENIHRCGKHAGRVEFTFWLCANCDHRMTTDQKWCVSIPLHLFEQPNINRWICQQNALKPKERRELISR